MGRTPLMGILFSARTFGYGKNNVMVLTVCAECTAQDSASERVADWPARAPADVREIHLSQKLISPRGGNRLVANRKGCRRENGKRNISIYPMHVG